MFGSSREALPDVREWLAHPTVGTGDVERPSRMSRNIGDDFTEVWEWSGGSRGLREWPRSPPGCPGVLGRPARMSGRAREALPDVREW